MKRFILNASAAIVGALGIFGNSSASQFAPPPRIGSKPKGGAGAKRAKERLSKKLKANDSVPESSVYSRQQRRADDRRQRKDMRSSMKKHAMQKQLHGGAAAVR